MTPPAILNAKVVPQEKATIVNVYRRESVDVYMRTRRNSSATTESPSRGILSGLSRLVNRQRSDSLCEESDKKKKKQAKDKDNTPTVITALPQRFAKINGCKLESVYDLREGEDDFYDDNYAFRRPRSNSSDFLILRKTSRPLTVDVVGLVDAQNDPYRQYMKVIDCWEICPSKTLVLHIDKTLPVEKAFDALCFNKVNAALVWDSDLQQIISIVTLTDFLRILQNLDKEGKLKTPKDDEISKILDINETEPLVVELNGMDLEEKTEKDGAVSEEERAVLTVGDIIPHQKLIRIPASCKVFEACATFCYAHVHRMVVQVESGAVLFLLTLRRILQAIHKQNRSLHFAQWLSCPIKHCNVGTWSSPIVTVNVTDTVDEAITRMLDNRISGLPLVNEQGEAVNVLLKNDVARGFQAVPLEEHHQLLASPVTNMVNYRPPFDLLRPHDPVGKVLDTLLGAEHVRSVFILDEKNQPIACISMSDIIRHLVTDEKPFHRVSPQPQQPEVILGNDSPQ